MSIPYSTDGNEVPMMDCIQGPVDRVFCLIIGIMVFIIVYPMTMAVIISMEKHEAESRNIRIRDFYQSRWMVTR